MPILVSRMLTALQAELGHRVLEIGAGTGYNAALLAHRLGARNVSTIEVDPAVAEHARAALHATGYGEVRVITGDGERGYAPLAPYDRLVSTAGVRRFPYQWVRQTRPGGRFITPWAHPYLPVLVELTVTVDGTAIGSVADPGMDFMLVRGQRMPGVSVAQILAGDDPDTAAATETDLHPYYVTGDWDAAFAIAQRVANCIQRYWAPDEEDEHATQWLLDPATGSWARVRHDPDHADGSYEVRQGGSRKLWDEVEAAFHWWDDQGRPKARDWRIEVRADRQLVTLPTPHDR